MMTGPNLNPVCLPPVMAKSTASTTVSSSPPTRDTMGTVPYLNAQSCVRPHGSNRDDRIHAGLDQVCQAFIMSDCHAHLFRIGLCGHLIATLQASISSAPQHDQLHAFANNHWQIFEKEIEPLLPRQATDDTEQKRIGRWLETKPPLQRHLVGRPALENIRFETIRHVGIEAAGDVRICCRIPD